MLDKIPMHDEPVSGAYSSDPILKELYDVEQIPEELLAKSGIIEFVPLRDERIDSYKFSMFRNPRTGIIYGIPNGMKDAKGNDLFRSFRMTGPLSFDLSIPREREAAWMYLNFPKCVNSPFQSGKPLWKARSQEKEAEQEIKKFDLTRNVLDIIDEATNEEILDFSRILGYDPETNPLAVIKRLLLEKAVNNPAQFIEKWNSSTRKYLEILHRGVQCGVVFKNMDTGYTFGAQVLGHDELNAIKYMQEHPNIPIAIDSESRSKSAIKYDGANQDKQEVNVEGTVEQPKVISAGSKKASNKEAKELPEEDAELA